MPCYTKKTEGGRMFICGDLGEQCAECGWLGENLCDYPVGEGKTCDRLLCDEHANEIAPDLHYCAAHFGMWTAYRDGGGVQRELENVVPFRKA
jgi:hypothetical protein